MMKAVGVGLQSIKLVNIGLHHDLIRLAQPLRKYTNKRPYESGVM